MQHIVENKTCLEITIIEPVMRFCVYCINLGQITVRSGHEVMVSSKVKLYSSAIDKKSVVYLYTVLD